MYFLKYYLTYCLKFKKNNKCIVIEQMQNKVGMLYVILGLFSFKNITGIALNFSCYQYVF